MKKYHDAITQFINLFAEVDVDKIKAWLDSIGDDPVGVKDE